MSFESFPFILGWELTLACNLRCRHCGTAAGEPREKELTLDESLKICDQLPELLVQEVDFTGGEPLMMPGWQKIFARLSKLGIYIKILTNGILLNQETAEQLKDFSVAGVGVSIDGLEDTHDRIRGHDGLFHRILGGISHVSAANLPISVITTVNSFNLGELPGLFRILVDIGVSRWQVCKRGVERAPPCDDPVDNPGGSGARSGHGEPSGAEYRALRVMRIEKIGHRHIPATRQLHPLQPQDALAACHVDTLPAAGQHAARCAV